MKPRCHLHGLSRWGTTGTWTGIINIDQELFRNSSLPSGASLQRPGPKATDNAFQKPKLVPGNKTQGLTALESGYAWAQREDIDISSRAFWGMELVCPSDKSSSEVKLTPARSTDQPTS